MQTREGLELTDEDAIAYDEALADVGYYDRLQYVYKIKLNSLYGALTNLYFRFYDLRLGESTTASGRAILRHQCRKVNELFGDSYDVDFPLYNTVADAIESGYTADEAKRISLNSSVVNGSVVTTIFDGKRQSDAVVYGDSVAGSTLIDTPMGNVEIESLFGKVDYVSGEREYSNCNIKALTYCTETHKTYYGNVKYVMRHKVTKQMYRVWVSAEQFVDVTEDHSLISCHEEDIIEVTAKQLASNESLHLITSNGSLRSPNISAKCVKIEKLDIKDQYVYDIEVDNTHVFFANNILVHNTDSTYFKTYCTDAKSAIETADTIAEAVNASYPEFMRNTFLCNNGFDTIIKAGREVVSDRGIFVEKKRYIIHLIDLDGKTVDKMKVMGLDTKKTTLPVEVSKQLNKFIERFLKGEEWSEVAHSVVAYKQQLMNASDITTIGLPKGVNNIEMYTTNLAVDPKARLPGHVAASIYYNQKLDEYNDKVSPRIISGMKIKVFYLKGNHGKFKSIALPTDLEVVPNWFTTEFVVDKDAHILRLVDRPLDNIIKAIGKVTPTRRSLLADSLLVY